MTARKLVYNNRSPRNKTASEAETYTIMDDCLFLSILPTACLCAVRGHNSIRAFFPSAPASLLVLSRLARC